MDATSTLLTGAGYWNPLAWLLGLLVAVIIAWLIYSMGEKGYKPGTAQAEPFISGNKEPVEKGEVHVRAGNLYWGYLEALRGYYDRLVPLHSGNLHDYILWYLGITALFLVLVVIIS